MQRLKSTNRLTQSTFFFVTALAVSAFPVAARGQTAGAAQPPKQFSLDNLRTPSSPAFAILDVAPTSVSRPSTPRALALELYSKTQHGTVIPNNYSLEVAPHWLRPQPRLSFNAYNNPSLSQSLKQSFSISFATSRPDSSENDGPTRVAVGVRVAPHGGHPSSKFRSLTASLDTMQQARIPVIRQLADALDSTDEANAQLAALELRLSTADGGGAAAIRAQIDTVRDRLRQLRSSVEQLQGNLDTQADSMRKIATTMGSEEAERVGLFSEIAAAFSAAYPSTDFGGGRLSRFGAWATAGYRIESPRLDILGLARLQRDVLDADQNLLDFGGRLLWLYQRLGISGELVRRTAFDPDNLNPAVPGSSSVKYESSNRAVAIVDFRATDAVYVSMSFGQDHQLLKTATDAERKPLIAALGLNLQWGRKPLVALP